MDYEGSEEEAIMAFVSENEIGNWNLYMEIMGKQEIDGVIRGVPTHQEK